MSDPKSLILARRARFLAAAVAATAVGAAGACGGTAVDDPAPCLSIAADAGEGDATDGATRDADAGPQVCLTRPIEDAGDAQPTPCLKAPVDGGS